MRIVGIVALVALVLPARIDAQVFDSTGLAAPSTQAGTGGGDLVFEFFCWNELYHYHPDYHIELTQTLEIRVGEEVVAAASSWGYNHLYTEVSASYLRRRTIAT